MVNWVSYKGAKCDRRDADEAYMGSFDTDSFNQGWTISGDNSGKKIELPWVVPSEYGDKITIVNTLPRLLETKLQSDLLLGKENILNPSHVRMLCYETYGKEESQIEEYENVIIKACPASEIKRLS